MKNEIVLFTDGDINIEVELSPELETVWLTQKQMGELFEVKQATLSEHINNIISSGELDETSIGFSDKSSGGRKPKIYNLDMILSVGYRVNSKRGIAFRRWANSVLKKYVIQGYAINEKRLQALERTVDIQTKMLASTLEVEESDILKAVDYSLGMKQRLAIARAILAKPEFLILDEPINALDPEGIREMRTLFQRLNQEDGTTIFISSHILSEVDLLADTIGIIQHGKLLTELPIEEIHKHQTDYISLQVDDVTRVAALLENMRITNFSVLDKEFIHIYDSDISGKALSKAIIENGIGLESMGRKQDTLEDFFFQLTEEEK